MLARARYAACPTAWGSRTFGKPPDGGDNRVNLLRKGIASSTGEILLDPPWQLIELR
jgi:hypothetical protein